MDNLEYLRRLRRAIVSSGSITADDVAALRDIVYSDGKVGRKEAEFLFKLRKELNDYGNLRDWDNFFIQAICDFVLDNNRFPNAIDDKEATWLIDQIGEDGIIDDVEQRLLKKLRKEAKRFPGSLQKLQKHTSVAKDFCKAIFLFFCGNTKTLRAKEYGVTCTGHRKTSVHHIRTTLKSEDDNHEA